METTTCPRCSEPPLEIERFCSTCGYDLRPYRPAAEWIVQKARERDRQWSSRKFGASSPERTSPAPEAKPKPTPESPEPAASDGKTKPDGREPPVAELVYWTQCARVLGDLERVAVANTERLRRECLDLDMSADELSRRIDAALPSGTAAVPDGVPAPAGWYPDPGGDERRRYWTGVAWTERLS